MRKTIVIHQGGDELEFVCEGCYDKKLHKRFAFCELQQLQQCRVCSRRIGWEEDRKITPVGIRAVKT